MIGIRAIGGALLGAIAIVTFADSAGAGPHVDVIRDVTVEAGFRHVDETNPCLVTITQVFAADTVFQTPPGPPATSLPVDVTVRTLDTCNVDEFGAPLTLFDAAGFGQLAEGQLQVSPRWDKATLNTVITLHEGVSNTDFDAAVDVTWEASGSLFRGNLPFRITDPESPPGPYDFILNAHENAVFQDAVAAGVVSDGTTNYAPEDSVFAYIRASRNGSVTPRSP